MKKLYVILILLGCHGVGALRAEAAAAPANDAELERKQTQETEKKERAETLRLAESSKAEDRIVATERLAYLFMDYDLLWRLMNDKDSEVRLAAICTLATPSCTVNAPLSFELARKMAALMEKNVTEERIDAAKVAKDGGHEMNVVCTTARSLHWLYQTHPLKGAPAEYLRWEMSVLRILVLHLSHAEGDEHEALLYEMLRLIRDPATLAEALQWSLAKLDDVPAARQLTAVEALWAHPLLGEDRPMNLILLRELSPVWVPVRDHILRNIKDEGAKVQAAHLLNRVDEAFAAARKQLGPQPLQGTER